MMRGVDLIGCGQRNVKPKTEKDKDKEFISYELDCSVIFFQIGSPSVHPIKRLNGSWKYIQQHRYTRRVIRLDRLCSSPDLS